MEAIISLGANLGDRLAYLRAARTSLAALPQCAIAAVAPIYETEPVDVPEHYSKLAYLNTIIVLECGLTPEALSQALHDLEREMGRRRDGERSAPRCIDLDLIAFGDSVRDEPALRLPHPRALERRFVCQPLADVRPDLKLPGASAKIGEIALRLPTKPSATLLLEEW